MKAVFCVLILIYCVNNQVYAHGPIHENILRITKEIEENPNNPNLYVTRGQYYQTDMDFDRAYADFQTARLLDAGNEMIDYHFARLFAEHNYPNTALNFANLFLTHLPNHVGGLMVRASVYTQLSKDSLAVLDFEEAIANLREPRPEYYIDIARATLQADSLAYKSAMNWLEKGDAALGYNVVLKSKMIDIALANDDYDKALTVVDAILEKFSRKEKWLVAKADILMAAKRLELAKSCYLQADAAIEKLPKRHRYTRMVMELEARIDIALNKFE